MAIAVASVSRCACTRILNLVYVKVPTNYLKVANALDSRHARVDGHPVRKLFNWVTNCVVQFALTGHRPKPMFASASYLRSPAFAGMTVEVTLDRQLSFEKGYQPPHLRRMCGLHRLHRLGDTAENNTVQVMQIRCRQSSHHSHTAVVERRV
jgi:hypothetical protein